MEQDQNIPQNYPLIPLLQETGAFGLEKQPLRTWPFPFELIQGPERQIIPINFFETPKLKLKKSFSVVLEYHPEDSLYIVDSPELNIYGNGQDEVSAIEDFKVVLEESYFSLKDEKDKLGPSLAKEWKNLNSILEEK